MFLSRPLFMVSAVCLWCCAVGAQEAAQRPDPKALMTALPPPPQVAPAAVESWDEAHMQTFAEGVQVYRRQRLVLPGTVLPNPAPDPLEVVACLVGGKNHESIVVLDTGNGTVVKAACLAWLGIESDGQVAGEESGDPPRGTPVRVRLRWQPDPLLEPDVLVEADVSTLVRNTVIDMGYPPLPFIYTGSRMERIPVIATQEGEERRWVNRFMLEVTKSVVVNFNEPDALIASPFPMAAWDHVFEINTANQPPPAGSRAELIIERATLPLTLDMDAAGSLSHDGLEVDDEALAELLRRHYLVMERDDLRAVGVRVDRTMSRDHDWPVLERLLRLAAQERCWVIPVFVLRP